MRIAGPAPLLLLSLLACQGSEIPAGSPTQDAGQLRASAPEFGRMVRAAMACDMAMSVTARDRAERIESATLEVLRREGGQAASEEYLRSVQPPNFGARRGDRAAWCARERPDVARADALLSGPEGAALVERAEANRATATR